MKFSQFLRQRDAKVIILDLLMLVVLLINLSLIVFDWIFASLTIQDFLSRHFPDFFQFYNERIHKDFIVIDLYFVAIFLTEFFVRWIWAVYRKTYYKWFFYPFLNWYDLLGCIPVGSLRFLRILRVISIAVRLQRLHVIDLTRTYLYAQVKKYYNVLVEEISDRVVINILSDIQQEIKEGTPITERVISEVIVPHKEAVVTWLSHRLQYISTDALAAYQDSFREYVKVRIKEAVEKNEEIRLIGQVPLVGGMITGNLEKAISDIVYYVITGLVEDLASPRNRPVVENVADITINALLMQEEDQRLDAIVNDVIVQSLELVKEQVAVQQWKLREMREQAAISDT